MKRQVLLCISVLYSLSLGCTPYTPIELDARTSSLHAKATITSASFDADDSTVTYFADLSISNIGDVTQPYSNRWLWLESADTQSVRANLDSPASNQIDFGTVELAPNESLNVKIYWIIPSDELEEVSSEPFVLALIPES